MSDGDGDGTDRPRRRARVGRTGARFPRGIVEDDPEDQGPVSEPVPVPEAAPEETSEDATVGRTGARFGSQRRRARRAAEREAAEDAVVPTQAAPPLRRSAVSAGPEADDAPTLPLFITATPPPESTRTRVRPYVRTGGRTKARADLAVETLVSIPSPRPPLEDPEHVALGDVVGDPRSVAEVAALLSVPLGVARVIIDDMAGAGLLLVHPRAVAASGAPSRDVMQRVLEGLHRL
ncbi:DUF742 domain-containing protein [Actinomycetospora chibensis]|uniref:DUF742 domain-containing protein n=1 Tax=Actinomycetospora chibensis TaxID=663606 RepID=A0ABV9RDG6_9PSEU|nr:DUF742 domain-containing protein [Actinomycetospora chibensis]MDD7925794.1 DUF742 domain-containing protein [Actinomycetospora chibensis]